MSRKFVIAAACLGTAMVPSSANAAYLVQVLGLFGPTAPATPESGPNRQFTLSFNLDDPFTYSTPTPGFHITTDVYNFSYTLDGQAAGSGLQYAFFSDGTSSQRGLDFFFLDQTNLYLVGPRIEFDGTLVSPSYTFYAIYIAPIGGQYQPAGSATVTITNVESPVPEPATWAMMIAGFGAVGSAMRRRSVRTSVIYA